MRNYVIINGVDSLTINGLAINELPPISKPPMRTLQEEIDGRDGDIITNLGYGSYDKIMTIGLYGGYDIDEIIAFFNGEGTIIFSNEPDKYYNYKIIEQIDYESLIKFRTATVTFHCQPFKYPVEEEPIEVDYDYIEEEGEDLTLAPTDINPLSLTLKGNTSQYSTTQGKNLFNKNTITSGYRLDSSGVPNGEASNEFTSDFIEVESGETYIRSNGSVSAYTRTCFYDTSKTFVSKDDENQSFTIPNNVKYIRFSEYLSRLDTMQLEKGNVVTPYEPFTPNSPSPNYPSPVNVVTGDNTIKVEGKNLFDIGTSNSDYKSPTNTAVSFISLSGNTASIVIQSQGGTIAYRTQHLKPNNTYNISATSSIAYGRFYIRLRNLTDTDYLTNNDITISGWTYNSYYKGWFKVFYNTNDMNISIEIPNCLYWELGLGFESVSVSTTQTISNIQIEKNSTKTNYVPYQSQTYPIYLGVENLLKYPYRDTTKTENGITFTDIGDGTIKVNGTASANTYFYLTTTNDDTYKKYNGKKLTISGCPSGGSTNTYQIGFYNDNFSTGTSDYGNGATFTGGDVRYNQAYIRISSGVQCDNLIFKPQLELGTKKNSYTPYGTTPIELCKIGDYQDEILKSTGKNLLNLKDGTYTATDITAVVSNGTITLNGTASATRFLNIDLNTNISYTNTEKYTISLNNNVVNANVSYRINGTGTFDTIANEINKVHTITYDGTTMFINKTTIRIGSGTTLTNFKITPQIELGDSASAYEPYGTGWYIKKQIGKVVLDGSESWELNSSSGDSYRYWIRNNDFANTFTNCLIGNEGVLLDKLFNDHFTQSLFSNTAIGKFSINNDSGSQWFLLNTNITALADFKTWLSTHNTIVYYVLATPTNTEITDTTLISQLEALKGAMSYKGQTNISQENSDEPFIIKARTMEGGSDEAIINNIGNTYAKPTIDIEGNGIVNVYLNGNQIFAVNVTDEVIIDSTNLEAYNPNTSALENRKVTGNIANLKLNQGTNTLRFSGNLTKATITDYVRYL